MPCPAEGARVEHPDKTAEPGRNEASAPLGLAVVFQLTLLAWTLSSLPGVSVLGPLVVALFVGVLWRSTASRSWPVLERGARLAAGPVLKLGIELLGV